MTALLSSAGRHQSLPMLALEPVPARSGCPALPRRFPNRFPARGRRRGRGGGSLPARSAPRARPEARGEREGRQVRVCCGNAAGIRARVVATASGRGAACRSLAGTSGSRFPRLSGQAFGTGKASRSRLRAAPRPSRGSLVQRRDGAGGEGAAARGRERKR